MYDVTQDQSRRASRLPVTDMAGGPPQRVPSLSIKFTPRASSSSTPPQPAELPTGHTPRTDPVERSDGAGKPVQQPNCTNCDNNLGDSIFCRKCGKRPGLAAQSPPLSRGASELTKHTTASFSPRSPQSPVNKRTGVFLDITGLRQDLSGIFPSMGKGQSSPVASPTRR